MTKLEWCREHAPEALKDSTDTELLDDMKSSYNRFRTEFEKVRFGEVEVSSRSRKLNYIFEVPLASLGTLVNEAPMSNLHDDLKDKLCAAGDFLMRNDHISGYTIKSSVESSSMERLIFYESSNKDLLSVDIKLGNDTSAVTDYMIYNIECANFRPEYVVSDKLISVFNRNILRHVKDLYYLYMIAEVCDLNLKLVYNFLVQNRKAEDLLNGWSEFESLKNVYSANYTKLRTRNAADREVIKIDFSSAYDRVYALFVGIGNSAQDSSYDWNAKSKYVVKVY